MMDNISRRQAVAAAVLTGAQALIGLPPSLASTAHQQVILNIKTLKAQLVQEMYFVVLSHTLLFN